MKRTLYLVLIVALAVQTAYAGAQLNVRANAAAKVFLDGDPVGQAPIQVGDVAPGFHQAKVENPMTGEVRIYDFYSPAHAVIVKDIDIQYAAQAVPGPPPDGYAEPGPAVAGAAQPSAAEAAAVEREAYEQGRRAEADRQKRRTRNTLLGAALANELLNRGSSKKTLRGVSLGGALLNELFRR